MTGASIAVLGVALLAVHVMIDRDAQRGMLGEPVPVDVVTLIGFEAREAHTFRGVATSNGWHAIEGRVALHASTDYQIGLVAMPSRIDAADLGIGLVTAKCVNASRPRVIVVPASDQPIALHVRLNAPFSCPDASLRIAYPGAPGIEIRDVHVFALPH